MIDLSSGDILISRGGSRATIRVVSRIENKRIYVDNINNIACGWITEQAAQDFWMVIGTMTKPRRPKISMESKETDIAS